MSKSIFKITKHFTAAAAVKTAVVIALTIVMLFLSTNAGAVTVTGKGITFQAFIQNPAGEVVNATNIAVNAKILSPNGCVLREENFTGINIEDGYLNLNITKGIQAGSDPGLQITDIFKNTTAISSLTCLNSDNTINSGLTSYTPAAADTRKLRISFNNGADSIIADFNMRSMPYAQIAESLNGKSETDFIQTSTNVTQTNLDTFLTAILQGACTDGKIIKKVSGSWACANESGVGSESDPTVQNFAKNAPSTGLTVVTNQLQVSYGTTAGTAAQGNDTRITGAFQSATTLGGDLSGTLPNPTVDKIKNQAITAQGATAGQVLRYAGANNWTPGFVSMFDLRSTVTGTQTFGSGAAGCTAGQTLTWVAATDNLACANISITKSQVSDFPTLGTVSGLNTISNTEITDVGVQKVISSAGNYFTYKPNNVACSNGQILSWDNTNTRWVCADDASGSGTVTGVTSANADIGVSVASPNPQLTLNSGTTGGAGDANKIAKLNASGQLPTAMIPTLNQNTTGSAASFTGSLTGDVSGTQGATSVDKIKGKSVSPIAYLSGQVLRYDGTSWVNNFVAMTDLRSTVTGTNQFASSCGANQTLTYNSVGDVMSCQNISITKSQVSDFPALATSATTDTTNASNITSGTLAAARLPALAGDVTSSAGSNSITINTVSVSKGGTGLTGAPTNGQILIGNGTGYTLATLTAGTGVTITNTAGGITISAASGVNGLRSCDTGNANDVMVAVGSWCVDKYEASVWSNADGSGTQYFSNGSTADINYPNAGNLPASFNRNGSGSSVVYAASKPNVIPARGLTWYQAVVACANSGKVLIPDSVWQTAAIGTYDPGAGSGTGGTAGGSVADAAAAQCNINTHGAGIDNDSDGTWNDVNNKIRPTAKAGATNQGTNACISRFGVEDMVGNLWEWTDMNGVEAGTDPSGFAQGENNASASPFATADGTWNINGSAYACDGEGSTLGTCAWKNNVPAAALRGGDWSTGAQAGVAALILGHSGSLSAWSIGFRCARPR